MTTLYLFPTVHEAVGLLSRCPEMESQVGFIGVGMAEAGANAAALIAEHRPRRVVLCGIAGACDRSLQVGDVVQVACDCVGGLPEKYSKEYISMERGELQQVRCITVSRTGTSEPSYAEDMPCIEQMEGAAVAAVCQAFGVEEYYHLRAISNYVDDPRSAWRVAEAVEALAAAVAGLQIE